MTQEQDSQILGIEGGFSDPAAKLPEMEKPHQRGDLTIADHSEPKDMQERLFTSASMSTAAAQVHIDKVLEALMVTSEHLVPTKFKNLPQILDQLAQFIEDEKKRKA